MYAALPDAGACTTAPPRRPRRTVTSPSPSRMRSPSRTEAGTGAELGRQVFLLRQQVAVGEASIEDAPTQHLGDELGHVLLAERARLHTEA